MRDLAKLESGHDWSSPRALYESTGSHSIVRVIAERVLVDGQDFPARSDNDLVANLRSASAAKSSDTNEVFVDVTFHAARDLKQLNIEVSDARNVELKNFRFLSELSEYWEGEFETAATGFRQAGNKLKLYEDEHGARPTDQAQFKNAVRTTAGAAIFDGLAVGTAFFSAGSAGGLIGAGALGVSLAASTALMGMLSGKARAARNHLLSTACFGVGLAVPLFAALHRGGLGAVLEPTTLITGAISASVLVVVSGAWAKVRTRDEEHEQLLAAVVEAEDRLMSAFEVAPDALDALKEDALAKLGAWRDDAEARFEDCGPPALDHLLIEIDQYRRHRQADRKTAEQAIQIGFDYCIQAADGIDVPIPEYMRLRPDLSDEWANESPVATTDWQEIHDRQAANLAESRDVISGAKTKIVDAHDAAVRRLAAIKKDLLNQLTRTALKSQVSGSQGINSEENGSN